MDQFISCDWGTSSFRLRLVKLPSLEVLSSVSSAQGIASVYAQFRGQALVERIPFYSAVLLQQIAELEKQTGYSLKGLPIVLSGMASATIGMIDLPYKTIPYKIDQGDLEVQVLEASENCQHKLFIISGVRSDSDVMRGEETILAGCAMMEAPGEQLFIFPGTHSKHIIVEDQQLKDFNTYMTGELFDLLANKSVLSASVESNEADTGNAFEQGIRQSVNGILLNNIFHVRTNQVFNKLEKSANYHYLSGLLIGEELHHLAEKNFAAITIVSTGALAAIYKKAIDVIGLGAHCREQNAAEALVKGQALTLQKRIS